MTGARRALASLACAALAAGCNITGARVYNLDELHDASGRHKYRAALVGDAEYLMRTGLAGVLTSVGSKLEEKSPSKVDDPTEECLDNLIGLLGADAGDPGVAAAQVELCARIALHDPWRLSRERAAVALGRAGARMRLAGRPARTPGERVATAEELGDLLARFVKAVTPLVAGGDREAARAELAALAAEARALEYDDQGLPRALRGVRLLAARLGRDVPALAELSLDLQERAIRAGLERALDDPDAVVAGAAAWAGRLAYGDAWCERVLARLARGSAPSELLIAFADDLARRGFPSGEAGERSLLLCYRLAGAHPDGSVSAAAMRALGRASGGELESLREEDWQAWWRARAARADAAEAAPATVSDPGPP